MNKPWTDEECAKINQEMGAACMDMIQHELVEAGVVGPDVPPMCYPEAIIAIARSRDALLARIDGAQVVVLTECNQIAGATDFDYGDMAAAVAPLKPGQRIALVVVE